MLSLLVVPAFYVVADRMAGAIRRRRHPRAEDTRPAVEPPPATIES
jgi:hypothetical protein